MTGYARSDDQGAGDLRERSEATAATAKSEASSVASTAKEEAGAVMAEGRTQAQAVAEDAKRQATRVVEESREQLRAQAEQQTQRLASSVRDVGQQLQGVTRGQAPQGIVADLATQASDLATQLADKLEQRRPEELLDEVRSFARRRPGAFLVGALGAGFVAGRLIKAVDTHGIVDAAKQGMSGDGTGQQLDLREQNATTAPSTLGAGTPSALDEPQWASAGGIQP